MSTNLMTRKTAAELVAAWVEANAIMDRAYADLDAAKKILLDAFGDGSYLEVLPRYSNSIDKLRQDNRRSAWRAVINMLGIRKVMSLARLAELDKSLDADTMPELTQENIRQIADGLLDSANSFATETVVEVFNFLRPGAREREVYKTNQKHARFELGSKVILTNVVECGWGGRYTYERWQVSHYRDDQIRSVDRIFHLADGAGELKGYGGPLIDTIQTTPTSQTVCETEYFRAKLYKNGNLHLEFKRPDLVAKLNRIAGNGTQLKGR